MYKQFTRELIQLKDFRLYELRKNENNRWVAYLEPLKVTNKCAQCGISGHIHHRKVRTLRHQWIPGRRDLYVNVPVIRYRCPQCETTWSTSWEGIPQRGHVTEHFKLTVTKYCFGKTIQEVARTIQEPYTNVERWYYEQASDLLPEANQQQSPESLCLDEFAIRKGHHYALAFMDAVSGHIWHTSEGKSRQSIQEGLKNFPFSQPPKVVVTDLAPGMSDTVKEIWPETSIVADKFHVIQRLTQAIERARKFSHDNQTKHKHIRHQRRLLMTLPEKLTEDELEKRQLLLKENPTLERLYTALQDLREVYKASSFKDGQERFNQWTQTYMYGKVSILNTVAKTLLQWKEPILNYFNHWLTNGPMEGTNNKIKVLKRRAYGYRNQERFFTRIRLECKQPA